MKGHIRKGDKKTQVEIRNLLDHEINIFYRNGDNLILSTTIPRGDGPSLRVPYKPMKQSTVHFDSGTRIPISLNFYGTPELPPPTPGVLYIVSWMIAKLCPQREDLLFPSGQICDSTGRKGCLALARYKADPNNEIVNS